MNEREIDQRLKEAAKRSAEKISKSAAFIALFNEAMLDDPICLIQMGIAIYMDKPIYLLVPEGCEIPANLRRVAVGIEYFRRDPNDMESIGKATERLLKDMSRL